MKVSRTPVPQFAPDSRPAPREFRAEKTPVRKEAIKPQKTKDRLSLKQPFYTHLQPIKTHPMALKWDVRRPKWHVLYGARHRCARQRFPAGACIPTSPAEYHLEYGI